MGAYSEAYVCQNEAMNLNPPKEYFASIGRNYEPIGSALKYRGFYEEAIKCYDKASELNPSRLDMWLNKAELLKILKRNTDAEAALTKAKELGYKG